MERLQIYARVLRAAITNVETKPGWFDALMAQIALVTGEALRVPRTSLWLFDSAGEHLVCQHESARGSFGNHEVLRSISVRQCPRYIAALRAGDRCALAVEDASRDPRLEGLEGYLSETGVLGLLDIPIVAPGGLRGVVCHEDLVPRKWTESEVRFATEVGAWLAVTLEAEQRGRAETSARRSEAKYRQLVEALPAVVYSFELRTGRLDYVSPRISELCAGLTAEQAVLEGVEGWLARIAPAYRERVRQRVSDVSSGGQPSEFVYPLMLPDGSRRWVRDNCSWVRDETGRPMAIQGTLVDVTELKEQQFAREEVEQRYRTLFEQAEFLTLIMDPKGRVQEVNERLAELLGVAPAEAVGQDGFALAFPEPEAERRRGQYLRDMAAGSLPPRFEATIVGRSGERRRVLWNNAVIRDLGDRLTGAASVGVDITERLQALTAVAQSQKFASLGRFAASVAHDFNNLLAVISTSVSLSQRRSPSVLPALEHALTAVTEAKQLTSALLKYARQEPAEPRRVNVATLFDDVTPILTTIVGSRASLVVQREDAVGQAVLDPLQFRQVLINLVANARDAIHRENGTIRVSCRVEEVDARQATAHGLAFAGPFFVVEVEDDGDGIAPEVLPQIFDPFFTTKESGTGLGLATCESIVRRAGGYIDVETASNEARLDVDSTRGAERREDALGEPNLTPPTPHGAVRPSGAAPINKGHQGTVFRVFLPLLSVNEQPPEPEAARDLGGGDGSSESQTNAASRGTVLVFDAREEVRQILSAQLRVGGYVAVTAGSRAELDRLPEGPLEFALVGAVPEACRDAVRALRRVTEVWSMDESSGAPSDPSSPSCPPLSLRSIAERVAARRPSVPDGSRAND